MSVILVGKSLQDWTRMIQDTRLARRGIKMDKEIKSYEKKPYVVWRFVGYSMSELQSMASTMRSAGDI